MTTTSLTETNYLYVEDDPYSREALGVIFHRIMKVPQSNLHIFENSADFLASVKALSPQPDVFLLDIHVTPHSGFEMLKLLRADPAYAETRIVALTASVMNEEVELLRSSGFNGVIAKPLNIGSLPGLMKRVLAGESVWHITET